MSWIDPFNSIQLFYAKILLCPCFCNSVFSFLVSHVTIKTRNVKEAICASDIAILSAQKYNFLTMSKNEFTVWLKVQFLNFSFSFCMTWYSAANKKKSPLFIHCLSLFNEWHTTFRGRNNKMLHERGGQKTAILWVMCFVNVS